MASVAPLVNTTSRDLAPAKSRDVFARFLDRDPCRHAFGVNAAGIAVRLTQPAHHRFGRFRTKRRRRCVIEIVPSGHW